MTDRPRTDALRILLCTGEFPPDPATGGIGTAVRAGAAALAGAGLDVHVLHAQVGIDESDREDPHGYVVHRRRLLSNVGGPLARSGLPTAAGFRFHADRLGDFDVVEAPEWEAAVAGFTVRPRQPTIAVLYTPTEIVRLHGGTSGNQLRERFERWGVRRADAAVSCGPNLADVLRSRGWHGADGDMLVQPPCLAPEQLELEPTALGSTPSVLGVGRLEPRKGFDLLVRAVARLPEPVEVRLVGRDVSAPGGGTYGQYLNALAADLGVALELVPPVPSSSLRPFFERSWVVAVPSSFESFSMVGLEAAAHGRPVVATNDVGFAALVGSSDGVRISAADPDDMAAALAPLVSDRSAAERAGQSAWAIVRECFGPSTFVARRRPLYGRLTRSLG